MSNTPESVSKKTFQENFVKELEKYKWKATEELNGNTHAVRWYFWVHFEMYSFEE